MSKDTGNIAKAPNNVKALLAELNVIALRDE